MKLKKIGIGLGLMSTLLFVQCDVLEDVASTVMTEDSGTPAIPALTNDEVIAGLKEALTIGIEKGANMASVTDGFFKNDIIKLPFPPSAIKAKEWAESKPLFAPKVEEITLNLNRAAESASKKAAPIFVDAIKNMSIGDGFAILKGTDSSATMYLQEHTTSKLVTAFKPIVQTAIDALPLTEKWDNVAKPYNVYANIRNKPEITTDLNGYVTEKGIKGLFFLVQQQEKKIRKDPVAQVTDLLKKVFGSLLGQ
jgi:hypothetical protein